MVLTKDLSGFKLFYQGNWNEKIFAKCIAVVGSRRMTEYGRRVIEKIVPQLVQDGWTIVSGFMYGVDQAAHSAAVDCGGRTIAVLGWGIEVPLIDYDLKLADKIIKSGGILVSQWQTQKPTLWTFPERNKVVAALSQEVIVVEAAVKSGSLITVELARKLNKKIWAVPGPITSRVSEGTNQLIANGKAQMWLPNAQLPNPNDQSIYNNKILLTIQNEGLDASEIARKLGQPVDKVGAELSMLVLTGVIIEAAGKYYNAGEN